MPHPEHAVDPLTGSSDGLPAVRVGRADLRHEMSRHRELGLTDAEYERIVALGPESPTGWSSPISA